MAKRTRLPAAGVAMMCAGAAMALPGAALAATYDLAPAADSFVSANNPVTNYGGDNFLDVHHGSQDTRRSYLRFDLTGLPVGEAITGATLYLYTEGGVQDLALDLHHLTDDSWDEGTLTWSNKPGYVSGALATATTLHDWVSWTLPAGGLASLTADADGQWSLLLKLQNEAASATATFYSRDATTYPNHMSSAPTPYLSVTTVPEASTWAMLLAGLGALGWVRRRGRAA